MNTTHRHIIVDLTDRTAPYFAGTRHYGQYLASSFDGKYWLSVPADRYSPYDALRALAAAACPEGRHPANIRTECICHNLTEPYHDDHVKDQLDWTRWAVTFDTI